VFRSAALKLTVWYLSLIMGLCIIFSVALYHVSERQLSNDAGAQVSYYRGFLSPYDVENYSTLRTRQLDTDRDRLKGNLVGLNLFVLATGGIASYALARRTLEPIEEALEKQKRFAADASHELRTPLAAMQTEIEVALRGAKLSKGEAVNQLKSNLEEVAKLRDLSDGLLQLASQDGKDLSQEIIRLDKAAGKAVERLAKAAAAKKIKIINKISPVSTPGDEVSLSDLAAILLDNAIKYSPSGSNITVVTGKRSKRALLEIKDEGQGIKASELPHIFERFYRADQSRNKDEASGYGLGLALARKIVDAHQGYIEVKSEEDKGSTFSIYLPL